jgi:hypothetical protein
MNNPMFESDQLSATQRWFQAVITHPAGVAAGVASADSEVPFEHVEEIVAPSRTLTGAQRLAIYSRSYHARLLECFRAEYPCLLHALGESLFNRFVIEYLQSYPPHSYTLYRLAESFPRFLAETRPDSEIAPEERESWPDFIIDLATLERAFMEAYDGPGGEGQTLLNGVQVLSLTPAQLWQKQFEPVPGLKLLAFRYPVAAYFAAVRREQKPELPEPGLTFLALTRRDYVVRFHDLTSVQYALLRGLTAQHTVAQASAHVCAEMAQVHTSLAFQTRAWLCQWADAGFFLS